MRRDCLNFGRNFAVRAKLLKILPDFFYLATYRGLIQTCHFSRHHFEQQNDNMRFFDRF
ncbi:hypothetical protein CARN8_900004 [mine drainage metagenome]|uniref:Uncharacterized protein n=1 Tax=mine drainage metagenome TaxID=410659 RepID=A0A3P3ZSS5_9ZZZZ